MFDRFDKYPTRVYIGLEPIYPGGVLIWREICLSINTIWKKRRVIALIVPENIKTETKKKRKTL